MIPIKNIFFDFDGVIVDSVELKTAAFRQMYLPYGEDIAQQVVDDHLLHGGVSRYAKFPKWHKKYLGIDIDDAKLRELANTYSRLVLAGVLTAPEVPGVRDFLDTHHQHIRSWVITGTPDTEIQRIAQQKDLTRFFVALHGSPTNKKQWIDQILDQYEIDPQQTLFIGDATTDWEAAQYGGLHFALRTLPDNEAFFTDYDGYRFHDFIDFQTNNPYTFSTRSQDA
ncbi:MAG: HAD hydrolase-like protein [Bacteroidota bacterium]